jgi:antirestriction protein ArdC
MGINFPQTKQEYSILLRCGTNRRIIRALENHEIPWQKPWQGRGEGVGYPREANTRKKFFGINFLLLQMSAKEHGFVSNWWGTADYFASLGAQVKERPENVIPGSWATETVLYKEDNGHVLTMSSIVYNADQLNLLLENYPNNSTLMPNYNAAEKVLKAPKANIQHTEDSEAWYYYPPNDYIALPQKKRCESGLGGLPLYYESLAHELMHWSEARLGFEISDSNEAIRELRADIGAAMLLEDLGLPHSISASNFRKWYLQWIKLMKQDENLIFKVSAAASLACDFILSFSSRIEPRFNMINENAA